MSAPNAAAAAAPSAPPALPSVGAIHKGVVKMVMSADTIIIRGQPRNGPPPEKTIGIAGIQAPKMARRPATIAPGVLAAATSEDEPFAWECREFLRKKLIGKEVTFVLVYKTQTNDREYGEVFLGSSTDGENLGEALVSEGLVEVRPGAREGDANIARLRELEGGAKAAKKGRWGAEGSMQDHVRTIDWSPEVSRNFVDKYHQKPIPAVIEQVRDCTTVRAFLLPEMQYITLMMSGVKGPMIKLGEGGRVVESDPYAEEAKYFSEVRLLQRDVEIILESTSNQSFIGSIVHPAGSIAELILREGYAKCVDWSIAISSLGPEMLRAAEKIAKDKRLRIWKEYSPAAAVDRKAYTGKVMEVINGDALMVKKDNGETEKVWLASVRPPRREDAESAGLQKEAGPGRGFRPLYDVPFMFEAREFLRKRLIHKKINITLDYVQPGNDIYPPRNCCTVIANGQNVAEALVAKGLATVVRYRQGDENRSASYDALLAAESKAEKSSKGIHSLRGPNRPDKLPVVRVQDLQGDAAKARQFLPYLQRAGRCEGIVEFVSSGSRLRVYIPKETCLVTILLSGISCPKADRNLPTGTQRGEEFGNEALAFTKERVLQREVEIEVENIDKAGSFIGWVKVINEGGTSGLNLAEELVRSGLATVHFSADYTNYAAMLRNAEEEAKKRGDKLWLGHQEVAQAVAAEAAAAEQSDRRVNFRPVCVTGLEPGNKLAVQFTDDGPKLEQMMGELRRELKDNPPVTGSYNPRRGDLCAARFSADGLWYRARVEDVPRSGGPISVLFIDFGNREKTTATELALLPATFQTIPAGAKEYNLAFLKYPEDADYIGDGTAWLGAELGAAMAAAEAGSRLVLNPEYRIGPAEFATLALEEKAKPAPTPPAPPKEEAETAEGSEEPVEEKKKAPAVVAAPTRRDIGKAMLEAGLAIHEPRKDRRFAQLMGEYQKAQEEAKKNRRAMWQYGDFTGTDI